MLASLNKFDRRTREGILAELTAAFLPSPDAAEHRWDTTRGIDENVFFAAQQELLRKLGIQSPKLSEEERSRVFTYLTREMKGLIVESKRIRDVRNRLGHKGMLRSDLYELTIADNVKDQAFPMGINAKIIKNVVQNPFSMEHLLPEQFGHVSAEGVSLFLGPLTDTKAAGTVLVLAFRKDATIRVDGAWILFDDTVSLAGKESPLDALKAFVDAFGIGLIIEGESADKFLLYRAVPITPGQQNHQIIGFEAGLDKIVDGHFWVRQTGYNLEVAIAFAIDVKRYAATLAAHGIAVTRGL